MYHFLVIMLLRVSSWHRSHNVPNAKDLLSEYQSVHGLCNEFCAIVNEIYNLIGIGKKLYFALSFS